MGLASTGLTTTTDYVVIAPALTGEKAKLKTLFAQNYEAAPAAANFLILYSHQTEVMRFPLIASGPPLVISKSEMDAIIPTHKMTAGAALQARLSAAGTVWVAGEFCYGA